ncbi:hypothetical protein I4U23_026947 [Adineta vaga]|nr:hypothetical protein I4U23_026947 [Adineta vaga]
MDTSVIQFVLETLQLKENDVTNIYHHGSWIYGTNSPKSDRDLLIVTRLSNKHALKFWNDFEYFHEVLQHYKILEKYDICIYTAEEFKILLEKNYLIAVQCIFLPNEFQLKNEIDFQRIYLDKYYDKMKIKRAGFYEMYRDWKLYKPESDILHDSTIDERYLSKRDYILKHFFHGLRYLDFSDQLIRTQSIYDYRRITNIFYQMKEILNNSTNLER